MCAQEAAISDGVVTMANVCPVSIKVKILSWVFCIMYKQTNIRISLLNKGAEGDLIL